MGFPGDKKRFPGRISQKGYERFISFAEAIRYLMACSQKDVEAGPRGKKRYFKIGSMCIKNRQYAKAIEWFSEGVKYDPGYGGCYSGIASVYREKRDYKNAREYIYAAIKLNPEEINNWLNLILILEGSADLKDKSALINSLAKEGIAPPESIRNMVDKMNNGQRLSDNSRQWIVSDIREIVMLCKKNGIKLILQDYPDTPVVTDQIEAIANSFSVAFVSHRRALNRMFQEEGGKRLDYFAPDGHCNAKGYAVMAANILCKIKKEGMLGENTVFDPRTLNREQSVN